MYTSLNHSNNLEIETFFEELKAFCYEQKNKKLVFFYETEFGNLSFSETYRALLDFEFSNKSIRNLFISHLESINRYSPTAAAFIPFFTSQVFDKNISLNHEKCLSIVSEPTTECVYQILESFFSNSALLKYEDCKSLFDSNGFLLDFSIKPSNSNQNACIFENSFFVGGILPEVFMKKSKLKQINFQDCNIVLYDGYIQEVSELNLILNLSYENKEKFVILSRGFSSDVQNTCAVNFSLNKTNVVLFTPTNDFWEDLEHFSLKLDLNVYGQITGTLLNNLKIEEQKKINVNIKSHGLFIKDSHAGLSESINTTFYINERDWEKRGILEDQLNFLKMLLQQISTCGIVKSIDFENQANINIQKLAGIQSKSLPAFAIFRALNEANNIKNKIVNIGCFVGIEI